ncbi:hypothetical protein [Gallaecimonas xiamenensis]|uniref:Lipoprotein n=1 Tax=Gallaecimonas xiamenensis 3-C-1 TaxID=745411 RepID=K2IDQ1_9GAMM|nr:hypothetical protein [Gallaecimonas xiamenensis]EKE68106.1 hypothetical protein B3C1_17457 [Gallaecimonas xiamenensis 3-C-1]
MLRALTHKTSPLLLAASLATLAGCGFLDTEQSIDTDRKEQQEVTNGFFATYWKGAKLSIRSMPVDEHTQAIDFAAIRQQQADRLGLGPQLSRIYDWQSALSGDYSDNALVPFDGGDLVDFGKEVYALSDTLEGQDEDSYPTFLEVLHHSSRALGRPQVTLPKDWNNAMDHWLFALVLEARIGLGSWKTYELAKVDTSTMASTDYRVLAGLHKGLDALRNQWYFLADEDFSRVIDEANSADIKLKPQTLEVLTRTAIDGFTPQQQFKLLARANALLMRGYSRHQAKSADLNDKALADIEAAIADYRTLGVENELVWLAESYVYISEEEKDKAIASLTKLQGSRYLSAKEKQLLADTQRAVQDRDPKSALNVLTDKVIFYRLGLSYALSYLDEIQWLKLLEQSEQGQRILAHFTELEQYYHKAKDSLELDNLTEKGKGLFKDLVE